MKREMYLAMMVAMLMGISAGSTVAYSAERETVYGRELMTEQERSEERQKMRSMNDAEREQYRIEKHERMKERAREQGKAIPDEVGEHGQGMGQGRRMGGGRGR
ncbi:hypothetical protein MMIC_P2192 [Mariprofundus micogutta]|uniref:Uncharacterized protein n=1 Tax=Mariprofundus micogutta TaxID=1921010 RepID=A0A1L8CQL0_9PROT|nr:hypothetical protein [Mariprofundus micogutta]GAV21212.1 hypothetical protein MMIC_P2192 [Mariprofundus micogutta]